MIRKLEVLANVAVIITSVVVCTVLVKRYLLPSTNQVSAAATAAPISDPASSSRKTSMAPGTKISLPGIDWKQSTSTLVLALSTTCHYCSESASFYQQLVNQHNPQVRLLAVLPQPQSDSSVYLNDLGVEVDSVQAQLASIGVSGTPTLILVDNDGAVKDSWVGKLSQDEAVNVLKQLNAGQPY